MPKKNYKPDVNEIEQEPEEDFLNLLDDLEDMPISPKDNTGKEYSEPGWKFYLKIRHFLPEWWEEFNGKINTSGKLAHPSVLKFIKSKLKNKTERQYLYQMIGPKPEKNKHDKYDVPWLGDWYKRRKNGYWTEDNRLPIQHLKKALRENKQSAETVRASAPFLIQDLMRINKRIAQLDDLYGGNPFLMEEAPTSKGNISRFKSYTVTFQILWKQKVAIVHEIMRVMGINPKKPNEMWGMAQLAGVAGQIGASAALTGATAAGGLMLPGNAGGPTLNISQDALLYATHLTEHAKDFELPYKINGKTHNVNEEEEKHEKRNGKAHVV